MQATNLKRLAVTHVGSTALAFGILVGSLTAGMTLALTGDLPGIGDDGSVQQTTTGAPTSEGVAEANVILRLMERAEYADWQALAMSTGVDAAESQLRMERDEFYNWLHSQASIDVLQARADQMDRADYLTWRHGDTLPGTFSNTIVVAPSVSYEQIRFLEQNSWLPDGTVHDRSGTHPSDRGPSPDSR